MIKAVFHITLNLNVAALKELLHLVNQNSFGSSQKDDRAIWHPMNVKSDYLSNYCIWNYAKGETRASTLTQTAMHFQKSVRYIGIASANTIPHPTLTVHTTAHTRNAKINICSSLSCSLLLSFSYPLYFRAFRFFRQTQNVNDMCTFDCSSEKENGNYMTNAPTVNKRSERNRL